MNNNNIKCLVLVGFALVLSACASEPELPIEHYVLAHNSQPYQVENQQLPLTSLSVQLAPYLQQTGLLVEKPGQQVQAAHYHRWAEPLTQGVERTLFTQLAVSLNQAEVLQLSQIAMPYEYHLQVLVNAFHGSTDGTVKLQGEWLLIKNDAVKDSVLTIHRFDFNATQVGEGYPAMVAALQQLLDQLADNMQQGIRLKLNAASTN